MADSLKELGFFMSEGDISVEAAAQLVVADAIKSIARALNKLATADASTHMGALEIVAKEIKTGLQDIADRIGNDSS